MINRILAHRGSTFTLEECGILSDKLSALHADLLSRYDKTHGKADERTGDAVLRSMLCLMNIDVNNPETLRPLLVEIAEVRLENGLYEINKKTQCARKLILALRASLPFPCAALARTLTNTMQALDAYDPLFSAHKAPGDFSYPPSVPVSDTLRGIDYTLEYLLRIGTELRMLRCFAPHRAMALLDGSAIARWGASPSTSTFPLPRTRWGSRSLVKIPSACTSAMRTAKRCLRSSRSRT